jgi:hypothetical protein
MPNTNKKFKVQLSGGFRAELLAICRRQSVGAAKSRRARILLMSDEDHPDGRRRDWEIAEAVGLSERQVVRIRQLFVREGEPVLERKVRPTVAGKIDGVAEAKLITICLSAPPDGRDRWTLQLLCDELAHLKVVESVCPETVRKCLKKTTSSLGGPNGSALRKATVPGSLRRWNKSSTSTSKTTTQRIR